MVERLTANFIAATGWLAILGIGFNVSSKACFNNADWSLHGFSNVLLGFLAFTPSNVGVLSVLSVFIGAEIIRDSAKINLTECVRLSLLGGIVVFFVVFFGGSWLDKSKFLQATQEDYFAIASAAIALGFTVGVNPDRVHSLIGNGNQQNPPPPANP